jgi:hypothetical protein
MAYDANSKQIAAAEQAVRTDAGSARGAAAQGEGAGERATNWAWSPANTSYDWMDSHAPFAGLD